MNTTKDFRLPINLLTGFLGCGKTTAIKRLLSQKPEHERWAIIVNEFGEIGIDSVSIDTQDDLELLPLSGGCVCCRLGPQLHTSLKLLLESQRLDRLLIEPTGMGHPNGIMDTLRKPYYRDKVDIRAVICLVDPRQLQDLSLLKDPTFIDQINMADIVIANKSDLASAQQIETFHRLLNDFYPPKQQLCVTQQGHMDVSLLDSVRNGQYVSHTPQAHSHHHAVEESDDKTLTEVKVPQPCRPVTYSSEGLGLVSRGWVFHPDDIFDFDGLETLFSSIQGLVRLKGVFRIGAAWVFINRVRDEMDYDAITYRRDSRLEILSETPLDWDSIEAELIKLSVEGINSPYRNL